VSALDLDIHVARNVCPVTENGWLVMVQKRLEDWREWFTAAYNVCGYPSQQPIQDICSSLVCLYQITPVVRGLFPRSRICRRLGRHVVVGGRYGNGDCGTPRVRRVTWVRGGRRSEVGRGRRL